MFALCIIKKINITVEYDYNSSYLISWNCEYVIQIDKRTYVRYNNSRFAT